MKWIEFKREGPVCVMTMDYEGENRFNREFCEDINEALDEIESDAGIKSVVITGGQEKFWSTGLYLDYMIKLSPEDLGDFIKYFNAMLKRLCVFPRPMIGAINGHVIAGGVIMAAHLDWRFMRSERGWVSLPEVDINIPFAPGMLAILRESMAPNALRDMALTGKKFNAADSQKLGFIDQVYPLDELLPKAIEWAQFLATKNTATYAEIKRRMRAPVIKIIEEVDPEYMPGASQ